VGALPVDLLGIPWDECRCSHAWVIIKPARNIRLALRFCSETEQAHESTISARINNKSIPSLSSQQSSTTTRYSVAKQNKHRPCPVPSNHRTPHLASVAKQNRTSINHPQAGRNTHMVIRCTWRCCVCRTEPPGIPARPSRCSSLPGADSLEEAVRL
jgi:hypothetical protein